MMRRIFGGKKPKKKRLSPSARTQEGIAASHPMYQYALNEYAQTVPPQSSNHNGHTADLQQNLAAAGGNTSSNVGSNTSTFGSSIHPNSAYPSSDTGQSTAGVATDTKGQHHPADSCTGAVGTAPAPPPPPPPSQVGHDYKGIHMARSGSAMSGASFLHRMQQEGDLSARQQQQREDLEQVMPDATYEEQYGEAYVGGPIRYIYPSGYQSMRPRGGPWKLSIAICISFTSLSVFTIGHCSDRIDEQIDDDGLMIDTRWCGSRLLYMMWVVSMTITGLAAAYCSIIGYIKVRDFAVANARSQPPGVVGKSDYYVTLDDATSVVGSEASFRSHVNYKKTIYQADGNPQFWGGHIYRPTQAAVAITSR